MLGRAGQPAWPSRTCRPGAHGQARYAFRPDSRRPAGAGRLIVRWNGRAWKRVPSPTPGGGTNLLGVAALSARSAWAVGRTGNRDSPAKTLALRWNHPIWK